MKRLSKTDIKDRDKISSALRKWREGIEAAIGAYVADHTDEKWTEVEKQVAYYNLELESAKAWAADIEMEIQSYYDEKSEKWQEGERGDAYMSWREAFESVDFEHISLARGDVDEQATNALNDFDDHADVLEQLPEEPD